MKNKITLPNEKVTRIKNMIKSACLNSSEIKCGFQCNYWSDQANNVEHIVKPVSGNVYKFYSRDKTTKKTNGNYKSFSLSKQDAMNKCIQLANRRSDFYMIAINH